MFQATYTKAHRTFIVGEYASEQGALTAIGIHSAVFAEHGMSVDYSISSL